MRFPKLRCLALAAAPSQAGPSRSRNVSRCLVLASAAALSSEEATAVFNPPCRLHLLRIRHQSNPTPKWPLPMSKPLALTAR